MKSVDHPQEDEDSKLIIGIVTPSRQRSQKAEAQMESFLSRAEHPERVRFFYYIDEDDQQLEDYRIIARKDNTTLLVGKPNDVSEGFNKLGLQAQEIGCDIIVMGNDDAQCKTLDWDSKLQQIFLKNGKGLPKCVLLGGNSKEAFAFPAVSKEWISRVGHYSPGFFRFFFHDKWIYDISVRAGCIEYAKEITIDHLHLTSLRNIFSKDSTHYRNNGRTIHRAMKRLLGLQTGDCGKMHEDTVMFERTTELRVAAAQRLINPEALQNTHQYESK